MNIILPKGLASAGIKPVTVVMAGLAMMLPANASRPVSLSEKLAGYGYESGRISIFENILNKDGMTLMGNKLAKAPQVPMRIEGTFNASVKAETIINEDFSRWTAGTETAPSDEMVTDEMVPELMTYPGDWSLFRMYEAGGNGYMGFDYEGDDGPGYIMCPGVDLFRGDDNGYYRFTCRVKNVNGNSQTQGLQAFILDGSASQILSASTQPMTYGEWTECEWIGSARSALTQFMVFGWSGEVLIDSYKVEKLIYPLGTPVIKDVSLNDDGTVQITWDKVEGASSYTVDVEATYVDGIIETVEVGDVTTCSLSLDLSVTQEDFIFFVTARNGEEISYPGFISKELKPSSVGTPVALAPTDVTADGFTANWDAAAFAYRYLVMPSVRHTATDDETYFILNDNFSAVPEDADEFNPVQVSPLMGMGGMDIYMSRAGWATDICVFIRLAPEMPMLALTNQFAEYGIPGMIISPEYDFSVGDGSVTVSGNGASTVDDIVLNASLQDENGEVYSTQSAELTTDMDSFEIRLDGGKPGSRLLIYIGDSAEGGDMALFSNLAVSVNLNKGESISGPAETVRVDKASTSARVDCHPDEYNKYSYAVQGYFTKDLMGEISNSVEVNSPSGVAQAEAHGNCHASVKGGLLSIVNPDMDSCAVFSADGRLLHTTDSSLASFRVAKGSYIVRIGNRTFKIIN